MVGRIAVVGGLLALIAISGGARPAGADTETCPIGPKASWTGVEARTWIALCEYRRADLADQAGGAVDPTATEGWTEEHVLSAGFLQDVLLDEPYRGRLGDRPVRIAGARVVGDVDLRSVTIDHPLSIEDSRFEGLVAVIEARLDGALDLSGSAAPAGLVLAGSVVNGRVSLVDGDLSSVNLLQATVGSIEASSASISGELDLNGVEVGGSVFLTDGTFDSIDLGSASLEGLEMANSTFNGEIVANFALIRGSVFGNSSTYNSALSFTGATVGGRVAFENGAEIRGPLNLSETTIGGSLLLRDSTFDHVDLAVSTAESWNLDNSTMTSVDGRFAVVERRLLMNNTTLNEGMNLLDARVGGRLDANTATVGGELDLNGIVVDSFALLRDGVFETVDLSGALIGDLDLGGSTFSGSIQAVGLTVTRFFLGVGAFYGDGIDARGSTFGTDVNLSRSTVRGELDLNGTQIGGSIFLRDGRYDDVNLAASSVDSSVNIAPFELDRLDLRLATIGDALAIRSTEDGSTWAEGELDISGTRAGTIVDSRNAWPERVTQIGFEYDDPVGADVGATSTFANREEGWYLDWLDRQPDFTAQPYDQLESALRQAGRGRLADEIAMARRDRERDLLRFPADVVRYIGATIHDWTVGYGFRPERSLLWIAGLVVAGAFIASAIPAEAMPEPMRGKSRTTLALFSLDRLVPLLHVRAVHDDFDIEQADVPGWVRGYFYAHGLAGFVLSGFIVSTLAQLLS